MKCLERLRLRRISTETSQFQDPHQFAYRRNRCTEDAIFTLVHLAQKHLDTPKISGLFKRVQHYPTTYTTPEIESHACESIFAQVDLGFSYRQKTVGEDKFILPSQQTVAPLRAV